MTSSEGFRVRRSFLSQVGILNYYNNFNVDDETCGEDPIGRGFEYQLWKPFFMYISFIPNHRLKLLKADNFAFEL